MKAMRNQVAMCLIVLASLALLASCATERLTRPEAASIRLARPDPAAVARGEYLVRAANCAGCHTRGKTGAPFAGGVALKTSFGIFYSRNITPDPVHGIGAWSDADFIRALRDGVSPDGDFYYPAFPFTSFTGMTDRDLLDIKAYLFAQKPVAQTNRAPDTVVPRFMLGVWRALEFTPGPMSPEPRGAYLANAIAHCGECHTPRDMLGGLENERRFAGAPVEGTDKVAPNITPAHIGKWSRDDIVTLLTTGMKPNGDFVAAPMSEVVDGLAKLTPSDRAALAAYVKSVPAQYR